MSSSWVFFVFLTSWNCVALGVSRVLLDTPVCMCTLQPWRVVVALAAAGLEARGLFDEALLEQRTGENNVRNNLLFPDRLSFINLDSLSVS